MVILDNADLLDARLPPLLAAPNATATAAATSVLVAGNPFLVTACRPEHPMPMFLRAPLMNKSTVVNATFDDACTREEMTFRLLVSHPTNAQRGRIIAAIDSVMAEQAVAYFAGDPDPHPRVVEETFRSATTGSFWSGLIYY